MEKKQRAIIFSLLLGTYSVLSSAADFYGSVTALKGHAFGISDERTFTLKVGHKLPEETEIITEEGAQISFMDYHDRQYHLSGAGHVKVTTHGLKLSRGYLWIRSQQKKHRLSVRTANALAEVVKGEGVFSFDNAGGISQLLAIKGQFKFAHFLDINRYEVLRPGEFSMINAKEETPRRATPIGFESYEKITALFRTSRPYERSRIKRTPASASIAIAPIERNLTPKQVNNIGRDLTGLYMKQMAGAGKKKNAIKSPPYKVITRIFGLKSMPLVERHPASLIGTKEPPEMPSKAKKMALQQKGQEEGVLKEKNVEKLCASYCSSRSQSPKKREKFSQKLSPRPIIRRAPAGFDDERPSPWGFERALRKHLRKTSRHKLEDEGLIEDLKNYRQDYKVNH